MTTGWISSVLLTFSINSTTTTIVNLSNHWQNLHLQLSRHFILTVMCLKFDIRRYQKEGKLALHEDLQQSSNVALHSVSTLSTVSEHGEHFSQVEQVDFSSLPHSSPVIDDVQTAVSGHEVLIILVHDLVDDNLTTSNLFLLTEGPL